MPRDAAASAAASAAGDHADGTSAPGDIFAWAQSSLMASRGVGGGFGTGDYSFNGSFVMSATGGSLSSCEVTPAVQRGGEFVWEAIRSEAQKDALDEPLLSSFLYASILAHETFERALAFVLSNRLASTVMLPTQLFEIFYDVLMGHPEVQEGALADVVACRERDPACRGYSQALLYYKGYHALQTQRIAHALWCRGQRVMALALQSRISEMLSVDIHPAARLGNGILLDHGTGVVIGETAVIGNNVSIGQNVTLGGTGKETGDRHPKISDNVLIGANATVLGNIVVGRVAQVAAGSLVLKPVPPHTMVAGSPAKPVGKLSGNPALDMQWNGRFEPEDPISGARGAGNSGQGDASLAGADRGQATVKAGVLTASNGKGDRTGKGNARGSNGKVQGGGWIVANIVSSNGHIASSSSSSNGRSIISISNGNGGSNGTGAAGAQSSGGVAYFQKSIMPVALEDTPATEPGLPQASAPLRGVHEGDVDATMDEEAAAVRWAGFEDTDPEYVI